MTSRFGVFVLGISLSLHLTTLSFAEESAPAESDSQDIVAVKSLEIALRRVEEDARTRRVWGGGLMLGLGAASAIGGVVAAVAGATAEVPISLGVTAVVLGGSGAFTRVSPTDQETLPLRFREMSENTHEKLAEKRLLGESYLTIFGYQAKRNRLIGSAMNIILGTVLIGWYSSENQGLYRTVNPILLYEGAVLGGLGILGLFVESDAESALKDYTASKGSSKNIASIMKFGVFPLPHGGIASLSFSF